MEESEKTCGGCLYQAKVDRNEVFCMVYKDWYKTGHSCENYQRYSGMLANLRLDMANEVRRRIDEKESRSMSQKFQIRLAVLTYLLGYLSAIVYRLIFP